MTKPVPFSAVLLAAGRSSRMGTDKALLRTEGRALWQRQVEVLRAAGAREIFLSARPEQDWVPVDMKVVQDAAPDVGPLAGIASALALCSDGHLAVLAVDLAKMQSAWFAQLLARCAPGIGAVSRRSGFYEPLAAIYPRELLPAAEAALTRGEYSLQHLLTAAATQFNVREITDQEADWFENWNEPFVP
jgi:molybdopterin-guanine dinucleotide biosynthesis protein A